MGSIWDIWPVFVVDAYSGEKASWFNYLAEITTKGMKFLRIYKKVLSDMQCREAKVDANEDASQISGIKVMQFIQSI